MKKMILLACLASTALIHSCGSGKDQSAGSGEDLAKATTAMPASISKTAAYKALLAKLGPTQSSGKRALEGFQSLFSDSLVSKESADSAFALYHDFNRKLSFSLTYELHATVKDYETYNFDKDKSYNAKTLSKNGFRLE